MKYLHLLFFLFFLLPLKGQVVDSTFGEPYSFGMPFFLAGVTASDFDEREDRSYAMLFLDDGRIIIAGHTSGADGCDFAFTRLLPDGKYDQSAGADGKVRLDLGFQRDSCLAASRYQTDKMLMGGCATLSNEMGFSALIARMDFDGNLDTNFGEQGVVTIELPGDREMITQILPLPNGNTIIAGNMYYGASYDYPDSTAIFIGRILENGQIDNTFGNSGFIYQRLTNCDATLLRDIELYPDGSIVITGGGASPYPEYNDWCDADIYLSRYLPNGAPDLGFGTNGTTLLPFTDGWGGALHIYEDGRILVAGMTSDFLSDPIYTYIARVLPNGTLDSTFNEVGYFRQAIFILFDNLVPIDIIVVDDEILVGVIDATLNVGSTFGVLCLTDDGQLNPEFGENGIFSYGDYENPAYPWTSYRTKGIRLSPDHQKLYFNGTYRRLIQFDNMMISRLDISGMYPIISAEEQQPENSNLHIYPNPVIESNLMYLDIPNSEAKKDFQLRIWDSIGRIILEKAVNNYSLNQGIDISRFANGVYFVGLQSEGRHYVGKLLVCR